MNIAETGILSVIFTAMRGIICACVVACASASCSDLENIGQNGPSGKMQASPSENEGENPEEAADNHSGVEWIRPPMPGEDPDYAGPDPAGPVKKSPYAVPSTMAVHRRVVQRDDRDPHLERSLAAAMENAGGTIAYLGRRPARRFSYLENRLISISDKQVKGDDDHRLASLLKSQGADFLLVDTLTPEPEPWISHSMSEIRLRLRDALPLDHFHPVVISRTYTLYRISEPLKLSRFEKQKVTNRVRNLLTGQKSDPLGFNRSYGAVGRRYHKIAVSLRSRQTGGMEGKKLIMRSGSGGTLDEALINAAARLKKVYPRLRKSIKTNYGVDFPDRLADAMSRIELEIDLLYDLCKIIDRSTERLLWQVERGIEGVYISDGKTTYIFLPSSAVYRRTPTELKLVRSVTELNGLDRDAWMQPEFEFGRFRTINWIEEKPGGKIISLYRGAPLRRIEEISRQSLIHSIRKAAEWLLRSRRKDDAHLVKYRPLLSNPEQRWLEAKNLSRHSLRTYALLLAGETLGDERFTSAAAEDAGYATGFLDRRKKRCSIRHRDVPAKYPNAKMDAVAFTLMTLLKLAETESGEKYEENIKCLGHELLYMQDLNGHFRLYDVPKSHPYYGMENTVFPGVICLALSRLHAFTRDDRYLKAVQKAVDYYIQWYNVTVRNRTEDNIYNEQNRVNLTGFVPWFVQALDEVHLNTGNQKYAEQALRMHNWIENYFYYSLTASPYPDYAGGYFYGHSKLLSVKGSLQISSAAAALELSKKTGRDTATRVLPVLLGARFLRQLQFDGYASTFFLPDPSAVEGAFRNDPVSVKTRSDFVAQALIALCRAVNVLEDGDYPESTPPDIPRTMLRLSEKYENVLYSRTGAESTENERRAAKAEDADASTSVRR